MNQTAILVLGMHRSGTSALTATLGKIGVSLGDALLGPRDDNKKGFFEDTRCLRINIDLLKELGNQEWNPSMPFADGWQGERPAVEARQKIKRLIASHFGKDPVFALKDPRLSITAPVWLRAFGEMGITTKCILAARHPEEVAASMHKRDNKPLPIGYAQWLRYSLDAIEFSSEYPQMFTAYDALFDDLESALEKLVSFVDRPEWVFVDAQRKAEVLEFLDLKLRTHKAVSGPNPQVPVYLGRMCVDLYEAMVRGDRNAVMELVNSGSLLEYRVMRKDMARALEQRYKAKGH